MQSSNNQIIRINLNNEIKSSNTSNTSKYLLSVGLAILCEASFATPCATVTTSGSGCGDSNCVCNGASAQLSLVSRGELSGTLIGVVFAQQCANASDTVCSTVMSTDNNTGTQYFKNTSSGTPSYYKCDWTLGSGTGFSNPLSYTPSGGTVNAPINLNFNKSPEIFATEIDLKQNL